MRIMMMFIRIKEKYKDFVFKLPAEIYEQNKDKIDGIILILDEIQILKELDKHPDSFLWNFRGYMAWQRNITYVLSGSRDCRTHLYQKEKDLIIALIDSPLKRVDFAWKLNVKSGSLSDKLNKLQNRDLILFVNGEYEISEKID